MANSEDIENLRVAKLKEINATREHLNIIYLRKYELEKELVTLAESIREGKHILAMKKTECEILTAEYWRSRQ